MWFRVIFLLLLLVALGFLGYMDKIYGIPVDNHSKIQTVVVYYIKSTISGLAVSGISGYFYYLIYGIRKAND
jgi:hypothetical protein